VKVRIFCAVCGSELVQADRFVRPLFYICKDEHPIALEPCPVCANKESARRLAIGFLHDAIGSAMQPKSQEKSEAANG
jgi:hypothetical protein